MNKYDKDFREYIRNSTEKTAREIIEEGGRLYPQYKLTENSVSRLRSRLGAYYNGDYKFRIQKGEVRGNNRRGRKLVFSEEGLKKAEETRFKKGFVPQTKKEIGYTTRWKRDNREVVKVGDNKWVAKIRLEYEKLHGVKLKRDEIVVPIDGDNDNYAKENLVLIDKVISMRLNREGGLSQGEVELNMCRINVAKLERAIKEKGG
jgi:hypothetical protein